MKLFWRVYLWLFASAMLAFALAGWHANRSLRQIYQEQVAAELQSQADWAASEIRRFSLKPEGEGVDRRCKELGGLTSSRVTVVLPDGRVIGDSDTDPAVMENHGNRPEIRAALAGGVGRSERFSDTMRRTLSDLAVPGGTAGEVAGAVRTSMPGTWMAPVEDPPAPQNMSVRVSIYAAAFRGWVRQALTSCWARCGITGMRARGRKCA